MASPDVFDHGAPPVGDYSAILVLERRKHLAAVVESGLIGPHSRVFVPGMRDEGPAPLVMGYEGSLADPGGEVQIGTSFFVQTQDYGTSEYLSLIGATLVRVVDDNDLRAFVEDADSARETGDFPHFLSHHLVRLCDVPALGGSVADDGPALRVYVDAEGGISTSPSGLRLGEVGEDLRALEKEWHRINGSADGTAEESCAVCLGAAVDHSSRAREVLSRPWLPRYHAAVSGLQHLRSRDIGLHGEIRVSGFGGRLVPALHDVAAPADERWQAPVLLWVGDDVFVHSAASDRAFRLDRDTGALAERLLVHGSVDAAAVDGGHKALARVAAFFDSTGVLLCE